MTTRYGIIEISYDSQFYPALDAEILRVTDGDLDSSGMAMKGPEPRRDIRICVGKNGEVSGAVYALSGLAAHHGTKFRVEIPDPKLVDRADESLKETIEFVD